MRSCLRGFSAKPPALVLAALMLSLLVAACGADSAATEQRAAAATQQPPAAEQPTSAPTASPSPTPQPPPPTGRAALAAVHESGEPHILFFWGALWGSCRQESFAVAYVTSEEAGVPIIGVPHPDNGTDNDVARFISGMSTQISHVLDDPGAIWLEYGVTSHPTMLSVSADGSIERMPSGLGALGLLERVEGLASTG